MKTTTVHIGEIDYQVGFDFSTMLEYGEQFGTDIEKEDFSSRPTQLRLFYAVLRSFNEDFKLTFREFTHILSLNDFRVLDESIASHFVHFYNIPTTAEEIEAPGEEEESESPNE